MVEVGGTVNNCGELGYVGEVGYDDFGSRVEFFDALV